MREVRRYRSGGARLGVLVSFQGFPSCRPPQFHMGAHLGHDPLGEF